MPTDINSSEIKDILDDLSSLKLSMNKIECALLGTLNGGQPGLIHRVSTIEKWIEKREWFEKLVISGIVTNFIGLIILIIRALKDIM